METIRDILQYTRSFGVSPNKLAETKDLVHVLLLVDNMKEHYGEEPLLLTLREACLMGVASDEEATRAAIAVGELLSEFCWAVPVVSRPEWVISLREAVSTRRMLRRSLSRLGEDFRADTKALLSAATRVLIEYEHRDDDQLLKVAGHLLLTAATVLSNRALPRDEARRIAALFIGE